MRRAARVSAALAAVVVWGAGCGRSGPTVARGTVSGTVTVDGKPVPHGSISFYPDKDAGVKGPMAGATIKDGKYTTASGKGPVVGSNIVRVYAYTEDLQTATDPESVESLLDEQFNANSQKKVTITAGSQTLDFNLPDDW